MLKSTLLAATVVCGLLTAGPSIAGPMSPLALPDLPAAEADVIPVHGCHRNPELGPFGWHVHRFNPRTGDPCARVATPSPRRAAPPPRYYDPYPPRRPACFQECNYIGPIRQCRTVCR